MLIGLVNSNLKTYTLCQRKLGANWKAGSHVTAVGGGGVAHWIFVLDVQEMHFGDITEEILQRKNKNTHLLTQDE